MGNIATVYILTTSLPVLPPHHITTAADRGSSGPKFTYPVPWYYCQSTDYTVLGTWHGYLSSCGNHLQFYATFYKEFT